LVKRGRHAEEGSFARSTGTAVGRAAALLGVAVVLGIVLLNALDDGPPNRVSTGADSTTTTRAPESSTTTTTSATTTTTVALRAPKDIKVLATNGTDVKGAARKATDALRAAGYNVLAPVDAPKRPDTAIFFVPNFAGEAQAVAALLGLPPASVKALPTPPPVADLRGSNILIVVGSDVASRLVGPSASSSTTKVGAATTTTVVRVPSPSTTAKH